MNAIHETNLENTMRQEKTVHEVFLKSANDGDGAKLRAGSATLYEGETHYVLRLYMFPRQTYYLVRNRNSDSQYTIFGHRVFDPKSESGVRFQNPVGSGRLGDSTENVLEIRLPLLARSLFMDLYPTT